MPQSLSNLLYHIIFSTKNRESSIDSNVRPRIHEYLGGIVNEARGKSVKVGGVSDHVHILAYFPATLAIPDAVRILKSHSSGWIHRTFPGHSGFAWQSGYAAFTVSRSVLASVRDYIENQESHHQKVSFQDEYRAFLRKHEIEFDERYVWD